MMFFNKLIAILLPIIPKAIVRKVSERYIAGATLDDAMRTVAELNSKGAMATVDVLGEFISKLEEADRNTSDTCNLIRRICHDNVHGNVSIKLTSLGLELDPATCEQNVRTILATARDNGNMFVRMDMENSPYTDATIALYRKLRKEFPNVGLVLQSYLRRTPTDIDQLLAEGESLGIVTNVRLCKGIYIEPEAIAFKTRKEVQQNYLVSLEKLFVGNAYVGIATHDDVLIAGAKQLIKKYNRDLSDFEFQMLLGVREVVRDGLIREGYRLRVYVPFGEDWYGYSIRRLKENPSMGGYIVKALFTGGR
jgi:proline dehydrogenase